MPPQEATKTIEFEGQKHQFPVDFTDEEISKALQSFNPSKKSSSGTPLAKSKHSIWGMPRLFSSTDDADTAKKVGRGALLGAAEGAGIPESTDPFKVVGGALGNAAEGVGRTVKAAATDAWNTTPIRFAANKGKLPDSQLFGLLDDMATNIERSGAESWKGLKEDDPELFAHGLGSLITQVMMIKGAKEKAGKIGEPPSMRKATGKVALATDIGPKEVGALEKAMPDIIQQAKKRGVKTVGELRDGVEAASKGVDQQFNLGLAPIANRTVLPSEIARNIRNLITPDLAKTAEGRAEIAEINRAAKEYDGRPWTIRELNAKRMTENDNLNSFYAKDSQAQSAALSRIQTGISKAVRDGASEIVYREWDKANTGQAAKDLKSRQASLWTMRDHLKSEADRLSAEQLKHEARGPFARVNAHAIASGGGVHAYFSGLGQAFTEGPEVKANRQVRGAFEPSLTQRAARLGVLSLPIGVLAHNKSKSAPAPPPAQDDSEE